MTARTVRINRQLRIALSDVMRDRLRDPRVHAVETVSIQDVSTSPDLQHAKVYVSVAANAATRGEVLDALKGARRFLRAEVARRVQLRRTPDLQFVLDERGEASARVDSILRELSAEGTMIETSLEEAVELLSSAERLLLTTHPQPDGDAVGSLTALMLALQTRQQSVVAYNPDPIPGVFGFLAGAEQVVSELPVEPFDLTVVLDCSDARMFPEGLPQRSQLGEILVVDHHKTVGKIGDRIYRDPGAAATGLLVLRLIEKMGIAMDVAMAEAVYTAILSDTGSFRYQNTNPEAMRAAARLLEVGVDPWHIASNLYESRPPKQLDLLAKALATLSMSADGRAAALTVTPEMLAQTGCSTDMVDGFINYARALQGVEVGILLRPQDGGLRVSLRSRGGVDVSRLAHQYGGGGHHNAAGFVVDMTPEALLASLFAEVSRSCGATSADG